MRIVCDSCATKYSVGDPSILPSGTRARCPHCQHTQLLRPAPAQAAASPNGAHTPKPRGQVTTGSGEAFDPFGAQHECGSCGKSLRDPLDLAFGVCEECRSKDDPHAPDGEPSASSAPDAPRPESKPPPRPSGRMMTEQKVYSAMRPEARPRSRAPGIALGAILLAAGAGAAAWIYGRPLLEQRRGKASESAPLPPAIEKVLPEWRRSLSDVTGSAPKWVSGGERLLRERGPEAALEARTMFQKALVLDPRNDAAIAGYVRSLALSGSALDDAAIEEALSLALAAETRAPDRTDLALARAELLLARPTEQRLKQARELGEGVLARPSDPLRRARAHLVIARTWEGTSHELAEKSLSEAIALDPRLGEAWTRRALAREALGDYSGAVHDLDKRQELDPAHLESAVGCARLYREVGQIERAQAEYTRILEAHPEHLPARLGRAALQYQAGRRAEDALQELRALADNLARYGEGEQAEILVHLAAAERAGGNRAKAVEAAKGALAHVPGDVPAHLQLLLLAIERRDGADAEQHLAAISAKLGDPSVEKLLRGRVMMLQSRWTEAEGTLRAAHKADPRRVDALLLAGISAALGGRSRDALHHLFDAARADPSRSPPLLRDARLYFEPTQLLAQYSDVIRERLGRQPGNETRLFDGVLHFHLGDLQGASKRLNEAIAIDPGNGLALAWRALVALRSGDGRTASLSGARAVSEDRRLGLGHYALGAALARDGKTALARDALREAVRIDPGLLGAEYELAALDAKDGESDSARERLVRIARADPSYLPAKELLFALGKGDRP